MEPGHAAHTNVKPAFLRSQDLHCKTIVGAKSTLLKHSSELSNVEHSDPQGSVSAERICNDSKHHCYEREAREFSTEVQHRLNKSTKFLYAPETI